MTKTLQTMIMNNDNIKDAWFHAERMIQGRVNDCTIVWPTNFPSLLAVAFWELHGTEWRKSNHKNRLEVEWEARYTR